jgi:DNA primase
MAHYSDELLEEVRSRNDIVDIISQYVTLKRKGRNFFGLCPFHNEKSPSFSVSPDKQIFKCFGCGKGGNVFHFLMNAENISFVEAVQILAERANIQLPKNSGDEDEKQVQLKNEVYKVNEAAAMFYHETLYKPTSKVAQEYVKKRKLGNNTLKAFLIGYAPMNNELFNHLKSKGFSVEAMLASNLIGRSEKGIFYDKFKHRLMIPIQDVRNRYIALSRSDEASIRAVLSTKI